MTAVKDSSLTTLAERQQRRKAVDTARASVRLEGFFLDPQTEQLNTRYINGKLTSSEMTEEVLKLSGRR